MTFLKIHLILPIKCNNISIISFIVVIYHEKYKKKEKKVILHFSSHYSSKLMKYLKSHLSNERKQLKVFHHQDK